MWVVVLENHSTGQILGNRNAPYLNLLARRHGLATRYYSIRHPSLPNYGDDLGLSSGLSLRPLQTRLPGADASTTTPKPGSHRRGCSSPAARRVRGSRPRTVRSPPQSVCILLEHYPLTGAPEPAATARLPRGLRRPPAFSLVIPDNQHNMHDGSVGKSDRWLHAWIPRIMRSLGFHRGGVIFITFDEGRHDSTGCCMSGIHGGRTPLIALTPHRHHVTLRHPRTAYSLLRTIENGFRVAPLGLARQVVPLNGFWRS